MPLLQDNMRRSLLKMPDIESGYRLPPMISIIRPVARNNIVMNPSVEIDTVNWSIITGGSVTQSTIPNWFVKGVRGLNVATSAANSTDGAVYGATTALSLTAGITYAVSAYVTAKAGFKLALEIADGSNVALGRRTFVGTGVTRRIWFPYTETAGAPARRLIVRKNGETRTNGYVVDAVQIEACESGAVFPTTYIDGDQSGLIPNELPYAYGWDGSPHASTSFRSGTTLAGGQVIRLDQFNFTLLGIVGLGLAPRQHQSTPFAELDGAQYNRTRELERSFSLIGRFDGDTFTRLRQQRGRLASYLDRSASPTNQPLKLLYTPMDEDGNELDLPIELVCTYDEGLGGNITDLNSEVVTINFTMYDPLLRSIREQGTPMNDSNTLGSYGGAIKRSASGDITVPGTTGATGSADVKAMVRRRDGKIYMGGDFTGFGASGADYLALYNPTTDTFSNLSNDTDFNSSVSGLMMGPSDDLYAIGSFTNAGGNANADYIVKYTPPSTYTALGTGGAGAGGGTAIAQDHNGRIYAGGFQTVTWGGVGVNGVGYYDTAWHAMGVGLATGKVYSILVDGNDVYMVGDFNDIGGVANTKNIGRWSWLDSVWHSVYGTTGAPNGILRTIYKAPDGFIYVGGDMTSIGGVTVTGLARYNGTIFSAPASSTSLNGGVYTLYSDREGRLMAGGTNTLTTFGGHPLAHYGGLVYYRGGLFTPEHLGLGGSTAEVHSLLQTPNGDLYIGTGSATGGTVPGDITFTVGGSEITYPKMRIKAQTSGLARLYFIESMTTGKRVYFDYDLSIGEILTFDFNPINFSFTSNVFGDISGKVLAGSQEAQFFLQPGVNNIRLLIDNTASGSTDARGTLWWPETHATLDKAGVPTF